MFPLEGNIYKIYLKLFKRAIDDGNIPILRQSINNKAVLKKIVNADPRVFYKILSSAITMRRQSVSQMMSEGVDEIYDDLTIQLIRAARKVHFGLFDGDTLLLKALDNCMSYKIIIELLKAGSDVNAASNYGSPLSTALLTANGIKVIAELINRGADVNFRDDDGCTPLFYGVRYHYDCPDLILLLLNAGSNVHDLDSNGRNVLMVDSCYCFDGSDCQAKESIDLLLRHGINDLELKHTDNDGNTVLHETHCKYIFELAIKAGVSIEAKNNKGRTPLLNNLEDNNKEKLFYLLKCGANVHSTDLELHTPLHVCILDNCDFVEPSALDMIIYHGGNMFARNINNQTPLDTVIVRRQLGNFENDCNIVKFRTYDAVYVIPKHIILFIDNGFDIAKEALEKLYNGVSVCSFLSGCEKELDVMRKTFIKDGLTFYEFCVLKRYYKSKCVNIALNEYRYSFSDISNLFPLYKNIIIIRIKDNRRKKRDLDFRRVFEKITLSPVNTTETDDSEVLNCDCLYHVSQFLNFKEMSNVFSAAIER